MHTVLLERNQCEKTFNNIVQCILVCPNGVYRQKTLQDGILRNCDYVMKGLTLEFLSRVEKGKYFQSHSLHCLYFLADYQKGI